MVLLVYQGRRADVRTHVLVRVVHTATYAIVYLVWEIERARFLLLICVCFSVVRRQRKYVST